MRPELAADPAGWAGIGPRLARTGRWRADRTVAFAALADPALPGLAGLSATDGLRGATRDGRTWRISGGWLRMVSPASCPTSTSPKSAWPAVGSTSPCGPRARATDRPDPTDSLA